MNQVQHYFQDLVALSHASQIDATHEEVVSVHMVRLMAQARGLVLMWHHVGLSRAKRTGVTQSHRLL
jgi:hypothetical protein